MRQATGQALRCSGGRGHVGVPCFWTHSQPKKMMTRVAQLLRDETGLDPDLNSFMNLCRQYRIEGLTA